MYKVKPLNKIGIKHTTKIRLYNVSDKVKKKISVLDIKGKKIIGLKF